MSKSRRGWDDDDVAEYMEEHGTDDDKRIYADKIAAWKERKAKGEAKDRNRGKRP